MASSNIRALEIAPEPSYCNLIDGYPSTSGLDFTAVEFIDASQITPISDTFQDTEGGRSGYYANPPEPLVSSDGDIVRRGTITLDFYLRPRGTSDLLDGLRVLLGTRFKAVEKSSDSYDIVSISNNVITFTDDSGLSVGDVLCIPKGSQVFYTHVINVSVNASSQQVCTVIPSLAGLVEAGDSAYVMCRFELPSKGGDPVRGGNISPLSTTSQPSVALRLTGDGWRQVCFGCVLTALTITGTGTDTRSVKCSATIDVAFAKDISSTTDYPLPERSGGKILHSLAAPLVISDSYLNSPPTGNYASNPGQCVDSWTLTLNWTCEGATCGNTYVGRAPLEATNLEATLELILGGMTTLSQFAYNRWITMQKTGLSLGFNTTEEDNCGGCIIIPAAIVKDGTVATVDLGAGFIRTHINLSPGAMTLDASGDQPMLQLGIG